MVEKYLMPGPLRPSPGSVSVLRRFGGRDEPQCLPPTRHSILETTSCWLLSSAPSEHNTLLIRGRAGSGKTTIMATLETFVWRLGRIGASIFFTPDQPTFSSPGYVIRLIAAQLAACDARVAVAIAATLNSIDDISHISLSEQFDRLIVEPLTDARPLYPNGPIVVLLDALDQCGTPETRQELLSVFKEKLATVPHFVRFVISSRPEPDIVDTLKDVTLSRNLDKLNCNADIEALIRSEIRKIHSSARLQDLHLDASWPGAPSVSLLVKKAAGSFLWVVAACRIINCKDPDARLKALLQEVQLEGVWKEEIALDVLLKFGLRMAGNWDDNSFRDRFHAAFGPIVAGREPLLDRHIRQLAPHLDVNDLISIFERFRFLIRTMSAGLLTKIHPFVHQFLSDTRRCGHGSPWVLDISSHLCALAIHSLSLIESDIALEMLDAPALSALDLRPVELWASHLPLHACRHWIDYIHQCPKGAELETELLRFSLHTFNDWFAVTDGKDKLALLISWVEVSVCSHH